MRSHVEWKVSQLYRQSLPAINPRNNRAYTDAQITIVKDRIARYYSRLLKGDEHGAYLFAHSGATDPLDLNVDHINVVTEEGTEKMAPTFAGPFFTDGKLAMCILTLLAHRTYGVPSGSPEEEAIYRDGVPLVTVALALIWVHNIILNFTQEKSLEGYEPIFHRILKFLKRISEGKHGDKARDALIAHLKHLGKELKYSLTSGAFLRLTTWIRDNRAKYEACTGNDGKRKFEDLEASAEHAMPKRARL
uniref:HNH nuclease domain-containing protein n=1 Tax=Mycena chlorophos TaxID=658473 RepID=A0ABQ0L9X4_MYCCL|nr:predicted protein [Mycena chlorophos]